MTKKKYVRDKNGLVKATTTTELQLQKPLINENYDINIFNSNMDKIDKGIKDVKTQLEGVSTDAKSTSFDNSENGMSATNVQSAIEENKTSIDASQSKINVLEGKVNAGQLHKLTQDTGVCKNISNQDLNNLKLNGFYVGSNMVNAPEFVGNWGYIEVLAMDNSWVVQFATDVHDDKKKYTRSLKKGVWSEWTQETRAIYGAGFWVDDIILENITKSVQVVDFSNDDPTNWTVLNTHTFDKDIDVINLVITFRPKYSNKGSARVCLLLNDKEILNVGQQGQNITHEVLTIVKKGDKLVLKGAMTEGTESIIIEEYKHSVGYRSEDLVNEIQTSTSSILEIKEGQLTQDDEILSNMLATTQIFEMVLTISEPTSIDVDNINTKTLGGNVGICDIYASLIEKGVKTIGDVPAQIVEQVKNKLEF